ncbi:MAG: hypothetical protein ACOZQL_37215 [Myxococcota bacterium]
MNEQVAQLLAFVSGGALPAATQATSPESAEVYWAIIAARSGDELEVTTSRAPATFQAMESRPSTVLKLGALPHGAEVELLRAAASALNLPAGARAIPFVLTGEHVCGVALSPPAGRVVGALVGHATGPLVPLEAVVFTEAEVVAFGVDGYSERFGAVTLRVPLERVLGADLDTSAGFALRLADGRELRWSRQRNPAAEVEHVGALLAARRIPTRRLVSVDAHTRTWQLP